MRSWTVGGKLFGAFGAMLALMIVSGVSGVWAAKRLNDAYNTDAGVTARKLLLAANLKGEALKCKSGSRRVLLAGYAHDQKAFEEGRREIDAALSGIGTIAAELRELVHSAEGKQAVADAVATSERWKREIDVAVDLVNQGKVEDGWRHTLAAANPLVESLVKDAQEIVNLQEETLKQGMASTDVMYGIAWWLLIGVMAVSAAVGLAVVIIVRGVNLTLRQMSSELREASEQVVAASTQVSTSAQSLSQGATEQAAALEESSASMEEMDSMTKQNATNAGQAASLMTRMDEQVAGSNAMLRDMVASMTAIQESSAKVSKIIKTIDEIAFQTNILALNAAVEAARAGEAGMGFAVVADEVRNLAQRAAQAARDTTVLIDEAGANAESGAVKVQQVASSIEAITGSVVEVKAIAEDVSAASRQQAQGVSQVSTALQQMEKVTQQAAATAEESAAASEELNAQAEMTMQLVERLEALVGRSAAAHHHKAAARPTRAASATVLPMPSGRRTPVTPVASDDHDTLATGTFGSF